MTSEELLLENNKLLREIALILKLQNGSVLEQLLNKVAATKERKVMWTLFDGNTKVKNIAEKTGTSERTVQIFIKDLESLDLVEPIRSTPKRRIEFVPQSWLKIEVMKNGNNRKTK